MADNYFLLNDAQSLEVSSIYLTFAYSCIRASSLLKNKSMNEFIERNGMRLIWYVPILSSGLMTKEGTIISMSGLLISEICHGLGWNIPQKNPLEDIVSEMMKKKS